MTKRSHPEHQPHSTAPDGERRTIQAPELTWNDQGLPIADAFDDPYFSVENGLEETRYVFLKNNGLP